MIYHFKKEKKYISRNVKISKLFLTKPVLKNSCRPYVIKGHKKVTLRKAILVSAPFGVGRINAQNKTTTIAVAIIIEEGTLSLSLLSSSSFVDLLLIERGWGFRRHSQLRSEPPSSNALVDGDVETERRSRLDANGPLN